MANSIIHPNVAIATKEITATTNENSNIDLGTNYDTLINAVGYIDDSIRNAIIAVPFTWHNGYEHVKGLHVYDYTGGNMTNKNVKITLRYLINAK